MSSTILHIPSPSELKDDIHAEDKNPFLIALGERVRALRARRGLTRKALASAADISERYLANLESGTGNASVLILRQVAAALQCSLAELLGDVSASSPEWLMLRELLAPQDEATLHKIRLAINDIVGRPHPLNPQNKRIALVGLRGAGKSTLGQMLADDLGYPFIELSREIEKLAGCSVMEVHALYGMNAYRRYEQRAIVQAVQQYPEAVIATPGGLVSDVATFNLLLENCTTVWLHASAEDHMQRVVAQGDMRPMANSKEAMDDLRRIVAGRAAFYAKAEMQLNTSEHSLAETFAVLRNRVRQHLSLLI